MKRIALLTAGGDCPGLNAVIRAVVKKAIIDYDFEMIGFEDGYLGLIENRFRKLTYIDASGILTQGGTILGTSNKANPFKYPVKKKKEFVFRDVSKWAIKNYKKLNVSCLIAIGGDGTLNIAYNLSKLGIKIIGIPKTIDNDLPYTDFTFGFDSALYTATEAIDKLHTTAQSHHRVMIIEVMGRYAGWLALCSGIAGGGDVILIPEVPYDTDKVCKAVVSRSRHGKRFSIIVVAEGARAKGEDFVIKRMVKDSTDPVRLGGIGNKLGSDIENITKLETRVTVLGHLQRGGTPTPFDRILATRFGTKAVELAAKKEFGFMVALQGNNITKVPLKRAVSKLKLVPKNSPLISSARSVGTSFGD